MKYSTWIDDKWEILQVSETSLSIDYSIIITIDDIKNNLNSCLNKVINLYDGDVTPEELEELVNYLREFVIDYRSSR